MKFQKGNKQGGRKKGAVNKITADIKTAIEKAFDELGGYKWLVRLAQDKPEAFAVLLGKILPKDINVSGAAGEPLQILIRGYNGDQNTGAGT